MGGSEWGALLATVTCAFSLGYLLASRRRPSCPAPMAVRCSGSARGVVIVTGGSRGIGAAVCERLALEGYHVVVNYVAHRAQALAVLARIRGHGGTGVVLQADVCRPEEVARLFDEAERHLGSVTGCVNSAGVLGPLTGLCDDRTGSECASVMATNLYGTFYMMREACRRMSTKMGGQGGAIVNLGAGSAYTGSPLAYAMSKGALLSLTLGCVSEMAAGGIRLNMVSPGPTESDMMHAFSAKEMAQMAADIPMGRPGRAEEVAAAVAWLLSDEASFVAGANLRVAGGKALGA